MTAGRFLYFTLNPLAPPRGQIVTQQEKKHFMEEDGLIYQSAQNTHIHYPTSHTHAAFLCIKFTFNTSDSFVMCLNTNLLYCTSVCKP